MNSDNKYPSSEESTMRIAIAGATGHVGTRLVALAEQEGHEVVALSRSTGFDLVDGDPDALAPALAGVEAVVDVTQGDSLEEGAAAAFFEAVARHLGEAATRAGVRRTVVLSIVGVDRSPDYDYYVAKLHHEQVTRESAPEVLVLRATQFHDFAGQVTQWFRDGDTVHVMDVATQPVDTDEVARLLLDQATGAVDHDVDLAGPRQERLVDQVRTLVARGGEPLTVEPVAPPASLAAGAMLPGDEALVRGVDWATWLERQG
jgi:uncharacterized protein YbjT (DUF2867 family)